jgi:hypothetical protein
MSEMSSVEKPMRWLIPMAFLTLLAAACGGDPKKQAGFLKDSTSEADTQRKDGGGQKEAGRADHNPRDVVERAIQVHGGPVQLAKLRNMVLSDKGEISRFGVSTRASREISLALPGKSRFAFELDRGTEKQGMVLIFAGDKGWHSAAGAVQDMTKDMIDEMRAITHAVWARTLLPLTGNAYELTALPEITIEKEPALGVKAASKGSPDTKLWFDKKSGYLVKVERPGNEAGTPVVREYFLSDFKDVEGLKLPFKQLEYLNGGKIADWTVTNYKFVDSLPEATFNKP